MGYLQNPYVVVTLLMPFFYVVGMVRSQQLYSRLQRETGFSFPWSKRQKFKAVKSFIIQHQGTELEKPAKQLLFYMNMSAYTVYIGFILFISLMIIGV